MRQLRLAVRALLRQPAFAVITVLTLALGIGANTAVFSVIRGVLLRPLPYPKPEQLQYITSQFPALGFDQFWVSMPEFSELRDNNQVFSSVGAYAIAALNIDTNPPSRPVVGAVTPELMPTLGVAPHRGRMFTVEDSRPNAAPVGILSYEIWQREYGGDESVVGRSVRMSGRSVEIVGIMPPGYDVHDSKVEVWRPLTIDPSTFPNSRGSHNLYLVGRLKDGTSYEQAKTDLERLVNQWRTLVPAGHVPSAENHRLRVDPLRDDIVGSIRRALVVLQVAVVFVLLIACANLANLLVARAESRHREYAVRTALGASRWQLFAQLLAEGLALTIPAAVMGTVLAYVGLKALVAMSPTAIPRSSEIGLDWPVLGFTLILSIVTGLVFALVPLLHFGGNRRVSITETSTRTTAGAARIWMRSVLVVVEVALAVTLVVGAGLLLRSFFNLTHVEPGFKRSGLTTFGLVLPSANYSAGQTITFYRELMNRISGQSGVQSVAAMSGVPPLRNVDANDTDFEHIPNNRPAGSTLPIENVDFWQFVTLGYTDTMGIPVVKGRSFELADTEGAPVALVNESLARRFFTDRDPIGGRFKIGGDSAPWFTIVGVLKDVKQKGVAAAVGTELYLLNDQMPKYGQFAPRTMNLVIRSPLPLASLIAGYRDAVRSLDPVLPLIRPQSLDDAFDAAIERPRFLTVLLAVFAGLALTLAAVGTYGILSYLVSLRTQEIGIRMALGADRSQILGLVLTRGLLLAAVGVVIGLGISLAATRVMTSLLFNVEPTDVLTLFSVAAVMLLVAIVACMIPAWRATRVDPLVVMRES
ncbi:MAG TPA: ABC transporter permease [Vicinamibacterales bacterium]|nr:ABC transporter permease [Vicinamibacterales bacterium]